METPIRPHNGSLPLQAIATVYNGGARMAENPFAGALYPSRDGKKVIFWDNCDADYSLPHYQWLNKTRVWVANKSPEEIERLISRRKIFGKDNQTIVLTSSFLGELRPATPREKAWFLRCYLGREKAKKFIQHLDIG
ncbi:MAG: hypothetical protein PHW63_00415 [Alphaproteobacteria bacterium]|nr:hypothetical protein [Alphaproteobacteria bacterium]